jgi:hypothetical protein
MPEILRVEHDSSGWLSGEGYSVYVCFCFGWGLLFMNDNYIF